MAKSNTPRDLNDIASFTVSGASGDILFAEGDAAADVFIIEDGSVEILRDHEGVGRQTAVLGPGDFFGDSSLLKDQKHQESARTITSYRLLRIDPTTFHRLIQENPQIAVCIVQRLAARLREVDAKHLKAAEVAPRAIRSARAKVPPAPEKPADPSGLPRSAVLLHAESGSDFALADSGDLSIGRIDRSTGLKPDVDLTELDVQRTLSRQHARVTKRDGAFYIREDTPTRNGTFVNGTRLSPGVAIKLSDGDQVKFGVIETVFRYR
jgi:CRP-like cAMP-binding protein